MMRRRRYSHDGQSLVEFALILPIFFLLLFGILDFGRAVYAYHTLNSAAREGARVAMVDQTITHIEDAVVSHAVALDVDASDVTLDWRTAFAPDAVNSCAGYLGTTDSVTCLVTVNVEYTYGAITPLIGNIVGEIDLVGESRMTVEFACQEPSTPSCPLGD